MPLARSGPPRWTLPAILAVFLLLGLVYIWQVPPFEGPDEGEHFAYVTWLVEQGSFPPQGAAAWETPVRQEAGQPPFYYLLASLPARLIDLDDPPAPYRINPYAFTKGPHFPFDNDNRALHYPGDARPLRGGWLALYLARLLSLASGALLVAAVWGMAGELYPWPSPIRAYAAALVALTPQVVFMSSVASNDMAATAFSALTFWGLARLMRRGPSYGTAVLTGVAFGLALLSKVSAGILALPIALGFGWLIWRERRLSRQLWLSALLLAGSAALVAGWWFVRGWLLYGAPLGLEAHDFASWSVSSGGRVDPLVVRWKEVFRTFWAAFGWGTVRPPGWVYLILGLFTLLALAGLGLRLWRWRRDEQSVTHRAALWLLLAVALLATAVFLELWMRRVQAPFGRLLYPALGAVALGLTAGWHALHPRLPLLPLGFMAILTVLLVPFTLRPAFSPPQPLSGEALEALPDEPAAHFVTEGGEAVAALLRAAPLAGSAVAGSYAPFEMCWRTLGAPERNYTVLLHLIGPEDQVVGRRQTYPGLGRYPTAAWKPGHTFCDRLDLYIEEDLPRSLLYRVEVAMRDDAAGERLRAVRPDGAPLEVVLVDTLPVQATTAPRTALSGEGPALRLLDSELPPIWRAGQTISFALIWGVAEPVSADYQLYVHLRDAETGETVDQADGPPVEGWYPTSYWSQDEVIRDERTFPLDAGVPPGAYVLATGFYDLASGERFGPEYELGPVEVAP